VGSATPPPGGPPTVAYTEFVERFVRAVRTVWPKALIQWEDFAKDVAFQVLDRFRDDVCSFNDAIQGAPAREGGGMLYGYAPGRAETLSFGVAWGVILFYYFLFILFLIFLFPSGFRQASF